jgi:agmatinase
MSTSTQNPGAGFDPNAPAAKDAGIYGLPFSEADARLVIVPVPWEATTSYGAGASLGPSAVLAASRQVDLFDLEINKPYQAGIHLLDESAEVKAWNEEGKALAQEHIESYGELPAARERDILARVNLLSTEVNGWLEREAERLLAAGKIVGVLGGDHASPLGAIEAVGKRYPSFGVLHLDAHSDTRKAYEGFAFSHASIMWNVCERVPNMHKLVQVGIRDVCEAEVAYVHSLGTRARMFADVELARRKFAGEAFSKTVDTIVSELPEHVWLSYDIDGLDPTLCPHTGTPVPGGLSFQEIALLTLAVARSGRKIIGFDLCEVAPNLADESDEWDANVGARLLFRMCSATFLSQGLATLATSSAGGPS